MSTQAHTLTEAQGRVLLRKHISGDFGAHRWPVVKALFDKGLIEQEPNGRIRVTEAGKLWCDGHHLEGKYQQDRHTQGGRDMTKRTEASQRSHDGIKGRAILADAAYHLFALYFETSEQFNNSPDGEASAILHRLEREVHIELQGAS